MNDSKSETVDITVSISDSVLKQIDRIAEEKKLTRDKIINDILEHHFSSNDDWIEDIIQ